MRKLFTVLSLFLLTGIAYSQSFHTITVDGINDFNTSAERFTTTSGSNLYGYVTYDRNYLYIGFMGNSGHGRVTDPDRNLHIYLDTDPEPNAVNGTGSTSGEFWRYNPTLPFSANYHYTCKSTNLEEFRSTYNGGWQGTSFTTSAAKADSCWEVRIKLSDIGSPVQLNVVAYIEEDWATSGRISGGIPGNLFTEVEGGGNITFNSHWLNLYLLDQVTPNLAYHSTNYEWAIRLKVQSGSLSDSTAYAGMSFNATNEYDAGVDLPKTPTPPSNYLEIFFPHSNWATALGPNFMRDFRVLSSLDSTTKTWDFTVRTDKLNASVTLSADNFSFVPANYRILIQDVASDSLHDMRASGTYTYNSGTGGDKYFRLIVGVTLAAANISVDPTSINYGTIKIGRDSTKNITITNTGDSTLSLTNISSTQSVFTFTGGTTYSIRKNQTVSIPVRFAPASAQTYNGVLRISSNDPETPVFDVSLTGSGQSLFPNISFNTTVLSYGNVKVESDSSMSFKIYNTGDTTLNISLLSTSTSFFTVLNSAPASINKNDSLTIQVRFRPLAITAYSDSVSFTSNDPDSPSLKISLRGSGIEVTLTHTYPAGWSLISVPLTQNNASTANVVGDDFTTFALYDYTENTYRPSDSVFAGRGYWLGIEAAGTMDVTGAPRTTDYNRLLRGGWSFVASPFSKSFSKSSIRFSKGNINASSDSAVTLGWIQNVYYGYDRSDSLYHQSNVLNPWSGYLLAAVSDSVTAIYRYSYAGSPTEGSTPVTPKVDENNWFVSINAQLGTAKDNMLSFGVAQNATTGFDNAYDLAKPPAGLEIPGVRTYFQHLDWSPYFENYAADIQAPLSGSQVSQWKFSVTTPIANLVTLSWKDILTQIPQAVRDNYGFYLSGPGITGNLDMEKVFSYAYSSTIKGTSTFTISSQLTGVDPLAGKPIRFALQQNYPNPFNPSTVITYSVKNEGKVTVNVYDILGNEVRTLVNEYKSPGSYQVSFDATGLSAGAYFYKLAQGGSVQVKKLIYLK